MKRPELLLNENEQTIIEMGGHVNYMWQVARNCHFFIYLWSFLTMGHGPKSLNVMELTVPKQLLPTSHSDGQKGAQNGKIGNCSTKRQEKAKIKAWFPLNTPCEGWVRTIVLGPHESERLTPHLWKFNKKMLWWMWEKLWISPRTAKDTSDQVIVRTSPNYMEGIFQASISRGHWTVPRANEGQN